MKPKGAFGPALIGLASIALTACGSGVPTRYDCTPDFLDVQNAGGDLLVLTGSVPTPTPGYIAVLDTDSFPLTLRMVEPTGPVTQVLSRVDIREVIPVPEPVGAEIRINIERTYSWGENTVVCTPDSDLSARMSNG